MAVIPRRLCLQNFLSYRECDLDFTGLGLAVLCGRNGEGKSALLDAMTWALWGEARGSREEDRIHLGEQAMSVQFDFEVVGDAFRVLRKRVRGRASGTLDLLQLRQDGTWAALTGGTVRETQQEITRRVRMDYETFASSAFVAQGHADEFTRRQPAERKQVFRKILGLERYEVLAGLAGRRRLEKASRLKELDRLIEESRRELQERDTVQAGLASVDGELREVAAALEQLEDEATAFRAAAAAHKRLEQEAAAAADRRELAARKARETERLLAQLEGEDAAAGEALAKADAVRARHTQLVSTRADERQLAERQAAASQLDASMAACQQRIAEEAARLKTRAEQLSADLEAAEATASQLPSLVQERKRLDGEESELNALEQEAQAHLAAASALAAEAAAARAEANNCVARGNDLKTKQQQLATAAAQCPVCQQPLTAAEADRLAREYAEQRKALGDEYRRWLANAEDAEHRAGAEKDEAKAVALRQRTAGAAFQSADRALHARLSAARDAEAALGPLRDTLAELIATLSAGLFATAARDDLASLELRRQALDYDPDAHERLRIAISALEPAEAEFRALVAAEERSVERQRAIARERDALTERLAEEAAATTDARAAAEALAAAADVAPRLAQAEEALAARRSHHETLTRRQGQIEERLRQLEALAARVEADAERARAEHEEEAVYGELARAFGKDGVQAMLMEQSLPRLAMIANQLLDRMTGGRIHVALATQKTTAAGKVTETLDILISDELGTRDYEMYSGGEAFRVDFALRIALAKLLALRSGADLPTLIIDEGFGTQDPEGIDRLVDALNAIAAEFRLVLVVTHVEELRERFQRRIEVTKDHVRGSLARVV